MRNGNDKRAQQAVETHKRVLILPMRNGNLKHLSFMKVNVNGSYPTYEEWKRFHPRNSGIATSSVLILPMRNGNYSKEDFCLEMIEDQFLSYL